MRSIAESTLHPHTLLTGTLLFFAVIAGCTSTAPEPSDDTGVSLEHRKVCGGTFRDGTPVHCEQRAIEATVYEEVPAGWINTATRGGPNEPRYYRSVDPSDPPGTFRLGFGYDIQRGALDPEITLDPIHGVAWHTSWDRPVFWESNTKAFAAFPEPIEHGTGPFLITVTHPHVVGQTTPLFNVSIETPELHQKRLEPLWDVQDNDFVIVHKIHGDGGPYYFHEGQPDTGILGFGIGQAGADYSVISRLIVFESETWDDVP